MSRWLVLLMVFALGFYLGMKFMDRYHDCTPLPGDSEVPR